MAERAKPKGPNQKNEQEERPPGSCFIVGAPIGEIEDLSRRGVQALQSADLVVTSDESYASSLMKRHAISKRLLGVSEGIEEDANAMVLDMLDRGKRVVLLTAPSFRIFFPLQRVIDAVRRSGREPRVLPGVDMATMAIAMSGFPSEPYLVAGTLPIRRTQREEFVRRFERFADTVVFYGGGNRLGEALDTIASIAKSREGALLLRPTVPGELIKRGRLTELADLYSDRRFHGEFCIILAPLPYDDEPSDANDRAQSAPPPTMRSTSPPAFEQDATAVDAANLTEMVEETGAAAPAEAPAEPEETIDWSGVDGESGDTGKGEGNSEDSDDTTMQNEGI